MFAGVPAKEGLALCAVDPYVASAAQDTSATPNSSAAVTVAWVFSLQQLMDCETAARDLRHIQRQFGSEVRISAVAVGMDPAVAAGFFRRQRVHVELASVPDREYRRLFGPDQTSKLYVVHRGQIIEMIPARAGGNKAPELSRRLEFAVSQLLNPQEAANPRISAISSLGRRVKWPDLHEFRWYGSLSSL